MLGLVWTESELLVSIWPSVCGWCVVANADRDPRLFKTSLHNVAVNCGPRSEITNAGTPCSPIILLMNSWAVVTASILLGARLQSDILGKLVYEHQNLREFRSWLLWEPYNEVESDNFPRSGGHNKVKLSRRFWRECFWTLIYQARSYIILWHHSEFLASANDAELIPMFCRL